MTNPQEDEQFEEELHQEISRGSKQNGVYDEFSEESGEEEAESSAGELNNRTNLEPPKVVERTKPVNYDQENY